MSALASVPDSESVSTHMTAHPRPLDGVRVLEFSLVYAGPYAGMHLADLGADVIKVEPPEGEPFRHQGAIVPGESKVFHWLNRGKRSLVVDLSTPEGREMIHRLTPTVDVVLINYRPGVSDRLEIDYKTLSALRPDLIYVDITAFGDRGPLAGRAGSDIVAQAYAGVIALGAKTDEDGAPESIGTGYAAADLPTGLAAAFGAVTALYHRALTREGQLVQTSLLRSAVALPGVMSMREPVSDIGDLTPMAEATARVREGGGSFDEIVRERRQVTRQRRAAQGLYYGGYRAKDGGIVLGALTPANRQQIRGVLGIIDDPSEDPAYDAADPENVRRALALRERVKAIMLTKTVEEWVSLFEAAGAPVAPVNFPEELADDPRVNWMMVNLEHEIVGPERMIGPIFEMSRTPPEVRASSPPLGRDTEAILMEAGYSAEEIAKIRS